MVSPGLAGGNLSLRERGAGSLADDLGVDRGVVLSRAAALLRSIESKPSRPVGFARDWTGEPDGAEERGGGCGVHAQAYPGHRRTRLKGPNRNDSPRTAAAARERLRPLPKWA